MPKQVEELIIYLRTTYHLGQTRLFWYLKRYYDIKVSQSCVYIVLKRSGLNRLLQYQRKCSTEQFKRYGKRCLVHCQFSYCDCIKFGM